MRHLFAFTFAVAVCAGGLFLPRPLLAGPYTESGIPGIVDGEVNPAFVGWASACIDYSPAPGVAASWQTPEKTLGPVTGSNVDIASLGDWIKDEINQGARPRRDHTVFRHADRRRRRSRFRRIRERVRFRRFGDLRGTRLRRRLQRRRIRSSASRPSPSPTAWSAGTARSIRRTCTTSPASTRTLTAVRSEPRSTWRNWRPTTPSWRATWTLNAVRYVRIVDIPGSGDFKDSLGNPIYDAWVTWGSGGVDLEAVGVLNTVPEPGAALMLMLTCIGIASFRRRAG